MRVLMSVLLLSLYFMSASVNTALRDPGITHLLQHHCPRVSLHGPSHGHSGPKTGISNSYTSFMVFPSVSLFSSPLTFLLLCGRLTLLLFVVSTSARFLLFSPLLFTPIVLLSVSFPTYTLLFVFVLLSLSQWSLHILKMNLVVVHSC